MYNNIVYNRMNNLKSLEDLEKKSYLVYFSDGIIELLFGAMLLIFCINRFLDNNGIESPVYLRFLIIPIALLLAGIKSFVTKKRLGYVKFSIERRKKRKTIILISIAAQLIALTALILSITGVLHTTEKNSIISLIIEFFFLVGTLGLVSYFTSYLSFLIFGIIMAISSPFIIFLNKFFNADLIGYSILILSGIIYLIYGSMSLKKFLNKYPKREKIEYE
ncbi:MAG: hypothetical protein QG635_1492 [Bacteroidota bacterium]|nr:hypothetical protein [Bacteroidota bacterium]